MRRWPGGFPCARSTIAGSKLDGGELPPRRYARAVERSALEDVPVDPVNGRRRYERVAPRLAESGPIDLPSLLPAGEAGDAPLELDIGFGRGASLFARHEASPTSRLLGIEIKHKWAYRVEARCQRRGLSNVRAFAADARDVLARAQPEGCLSKVFVHFPDPWWKKRHAKRRVLGADVLDDLARLLEPRGVLFVQTDVADRMEIYAALVRANDAFTDVRSLEDNPFGSVSNRERRAVDDGLPIHRLIAIRSESSS